MKLVPFCRSAIVTAVSIVSAIASNPHPSLADTPTRIIGTAGQLDLAIFDNPQASFGIGCEAVRRLWGGIDTHQVTPQEYIRFAMSLSSRLKGEFECNAPGSVKAYLSPGFNGGYGIVSFPATLKNSPLSAYSPRETLIRVKEPLQFIRAIGITPILR